MRNIREKIIEVLYEIEPAALLEDDGDLFESDILDSMGVLFLITELEQEYQIEIPMELAEPEKFNTIEHIEEFIKTLIKQNG